MIKKGKVLKDKMSYYKVVFNDPIKDYEIKMLKKQQITHLEYDLSSK